MPTFLRSRCALVALVAVCGALASSPPPSEAGIFLELNFENDVVGNPIPTSFPDRDPIPIHRAYATGGFPDSRDYQGSTTVVSSIGGMSNAALMSTDQAGIGANYIDTLFNVRGDVITLDFDLHIAKQSEETYPQNGIGSEHGQMFVVQAFGLTGTRIFRFVVAPDGTNDGGSFGLRDTSAMGNVDVFAQYEVGKDYHVSIAANYLTSTVNASVSFDNTIIGEIFNQPFVAPQGPNGGMSEFFIFQNNNIDGNLNEVALDNIVGTVATPEPSSLAIFGIGSLCCAGLARRRRVVGVAA